MISQEFLGLLNTMKDIHIRKNAGYSGIDNPDSWANFRQSELFGVPAHLGCMVRLSDKFIRAGNLLRNPENEQVGEAIEDTLIDLAVYSLIEICLYREYNGRKRGTELRGELGDSSQATSGTGRFVQGAIWSDTPK